jgi:uncharacterized protein
MKNSQANPSPLGSLGFGMTTVLFSIVNAGFFQTNAMLFSMAIFLGGTGQLVAGWLEYKRGNTFGFTSYTMFALYWYTIVSMAILPILNLTTPADTMFMGWFFLLWTVFTVMLFIKTLSKDKLTRFVFLTVIILFGLITLHSFTQIQFIGTLSGIVGIICGGSAMFSAYKGLN